MERSAANAADAVRNVQPTMPDSMVVELKALRPAMTTSTPDSFGFTAGAAFVINIAPTALHSVGRTWHEADFPAVWQDGHASRGLMRRARWCGAPVLDCGCEGAFRQVP